MTAVAIVQTPALWGSSAVELGNDGTTWRKKVLPIGEVEYQGRMLKFDRDYLQTLATAFDSGAYDLVPFQIADDDNKHTNNPERTRGWVTGMSADDDGLWVTVMTTPEGSALLSSNPRLGVSARIVEEYARSDGNYFPAAIQHVLGTLDPRITGLGEWEAVDMSNGITDHAEMFIDLSASDWDGEPEWDPLDFAADGGGHPVARSMRALSKTLAAQYPDLGAADHVADAADALDNGVHEGAIRHLRAAIGNMTPTSLRRHGILSDAEHNGAKASMDDIHRHLLLVQEDRDAQATDHQPDVKARTDVAQPIPSGRQRMGTYANDEYGYDVIDFAEAASAAIEMAHAQAARREAEDAARPMRAAAGAAPTTH